MPLTPSQKRKLDRMFSTLDLNGDGLVDRADFTRRVEAFARRCGWEEGSPEYLRNLQFTLEEWHNLCESADVNDNGNVTREEFLRYGDIFLDDRAAVRAYARGDVQLLFDAMDTDGDGRVTGDEYRVYLEVCGIDTSGADAFFAHADVNQDGRITRDEMAHAVEEFLLSENPGAGGNHLFGPLGRG
ncbi:MAG: EF-hand domain-containing protein [Gemmatimonadota bacterium]|nr:EF-hand domain-containing protein [Gemmatimonadota bacterium]